MASEEFSAQSGRVGDQQGVLRLGVTEMIAQTWLHAYLKKLKLEFPNVSVELTVDFSINFRRELVELAYKWVASPLIFTASYVHSRASGLVKRAAELGRKIAKSSR